MKINEMHVIKWLMDGEVGLSSKNIVRFLLTGKSDGSYPHDPSDLRRCIHVLDQISGLAINFHRMSEAGPIWKAYAKNWDLLTNTLRYEMSRPNNGGNAPKTWALM